jgi:hypothetical protein
MGIGSFVVEHTPKHYKLARKNNIFVFGAGSSPILKQGKKTTPKWKTLFGLVRISLE